MIHIKNSGQIEKMRNANQLVGKLLEELEKHIKPGISTYDIDKIADEFVNEHNAKAAFKGYCIPNLEPFPGNVCASINSCIVHGIPSRTSILKSGDIIGIDFGIKKNGYYGDGARTYKVGDVSTKAEKLLSITQEALDRGIAKAKVGFRVGDVSHAIGSFVNKKGYFVADNLTGHGIGKKLHEEPIVPNIGKQNRGPRLKEGMTIAIEPMVNIGTNEVIEKGWEFFVKDGSLSAHYEHTILITENEPEILTKL